MRHHELHDAMAARDNGLRRISRLTRRIATAGAALSAVFALAFSHHSAAATTAAGPSKPARGGSGTTGAGGTRPASKHGTGARKAKHSTGQLQPPAQNPAPAPGGGQVVSGGS